MNYGKGQVDISIPEKNLISVLEGKNIENSNSEEETILNALDNTIGSAKLSELVHAGEKVCIVISDVTRAWQKMSTFLPYVVDEITKGGVKDEDIIFISATGSHREQTKEEHELLLGTKLASRFKVYDNDCLDEDNLVYLGKTKHGTPVSVNKRAMQCDHIILTGAIVFHFLVGWGGGKKSILPGISSYKTIMKNHSLALNATPGDGSNPVIKCGNIVDNPIYEDMLEAASFVRPTFIFNVIIDGNGKICDAVAGNYIKAHEAGCKIVDQMDGVKINKKADLVIASAGGFPKDINLYQTSKTLLNAREALKKGGTLIIISECSEGFGNEDVEEIIHNYNSLYEREMAIRETFTIARYIGYLMSEAAENFQFLLVSNMDGKLVENANIRVVKTIEEALEITYKTKGKDLETYLMPHGANTLPKI